jgi:hypothetical protein
MMPNTPITPAEALALAAEVRTLHDTAPQYCPACWGLTPCVGAKLAVAVESLAAQVEAQAARLAVYDALAERAKASEGLAMTPLADAVECMRLRDDLAKEAGR